MKDFKFLSFLIVFLLCLGVLAPAYSAAKATPTSTMIVTAKSLTVRSKPSTSSKNMGSLKKGTKIKVYTITKSGWAETRYRQKKTYVLSKYLHMSYLLNKSKIYTYRNLETEKKEIWTYKKHDKGWDLWEVSNQKGYYQIVKEDTSGLHGVYGGAYSENVTDLKYPIKKGKTWTNWIEESSYKLTITSVKKTLKTPAGTFKNVVEVKGPDWTNYYAPNVGWIAGKNSDNRFYYMILKISKR